MLQEFLEFLDGEACVTNDAAHREFVDRVVARDRENATPITHYDVFALVDDFEAGLFVSNEQPGDDLCQEASARLRWNFDLAHLRTL